MSLAESVAELLQRRIGLNLAALGPNCLPAAMAVRLRTLDMNDPVAYAARLATDAVEFQTLTEALLVPETWFYRGDRGLAFLAEHVGRMVPAPTTRRPFRILSAACSTGEEPYSMAIALLEAGVPATAWTMDAVDLSLRNLAKAREGWYAGLSFRQLVPPLRDRYFAARDGGWEIRAELRAAVRFQPGNLLDPFLLAGETPYDLILCRNVLIYLTPEARLKTVWNLSRLLVPGGLLAGGHAEPWDQLDPRLQRVGPPEAFVYQRQEPFREDRPLVKRELVPAIPHSACGVQPATSPANNAAATPASHHHRLTQARGLADAGALDEAQTVCRAELEEKGPTAEGLTLLGLIKQARHETAEAGRCWQQALYLQPDHQEALLHLMLWHEQRGALAQAALLRRRLQRASGGDNV